MCLYVLLTVYETKDTSTETESLYAKIQEINPKTSPFVDYIHLSQLSKVGLEIVDRILSTFHDLGRFYVSMLMKSISRNISMVCCVQAIVLLRFLYS